MNTGEMLDALSKVGCPRVGRMKDGTWYAAIELPAPEGVTVKVDSDFHHSTHESALTQLMARVGELSVVAETAKLIQVDR